MFDDTFPVRKLVPGTFMMLHDGNMLLVLSVSFVWRPARVRVTVLARQNYIWEYNFDRGDEYYCDRVFLP
jgi:hypothetical protein